MSSPFYITTPIYYVNDAPHLGHAYTTIVADTFARYHRMRGDDTRFLTGTDEHGQKVEDAAKKRELTPKELTDLVSPRFDEMWQALGIERYRFIRTTDPKHAAVVATLWRRIRERNPDDLYLASYQGWYCRGCEAFYTESQLVRDADAWLCAIHKAPVDWVDKERSWFFRLSRYAEPLLAHIERHPEFVRPEAYRNEVVAFLKGGLKDLSVSRTSFAWGIPAPEPDPEGLPHVIYVWLDALTNYLSDLCPPDGTIGGPDVARYWPEAIHVIGKDILRFHAVYWPAFLLAAGLPLPKGIFAHGWWTVRGEKISKSMPATRIDPVALADAFGASRAIGVDAVRYYLLREVPLGADGDFTFESLFGRFNAELANDLGNLANRSLTLVGKLRAQAPPAYSAELAGSGAYAELAASAAAAIESTAAAFDAFAPSRALEAIWKLVRDANRYVDQAAPWQLAKDPARRAELAHALHALGTVIGVIGGLVTPVLPTTGRTLRGWVGIPDAERDAWPSASDLARPLDTARIPERPTPLFPRLDDARQDQIVAAIVPPALAASPKPAGADASATAPASSATAAAAATITYDDFARLDLRVGKVLAATAVPKKDKLLHLQVDLGEPRPRSIVAGIAQVFAPDTLVGKQVVVVANLAPRKLAGLVSEGMILAAGGEQILGLSAIDRDVPPGTPVK